MFQEQNDVKQNNWELLNKHQAVKYMYKKCISFG